MKRLILPAAVAMLALVSCKKSNGDVAKSITKENIVGTFKLTAITYSYLGTQMDGMKNMEACAKDDLYIFKAGDAFEYSDAGTKCDPDGGHSSTWTLTGDEINVDGDTGKVTLLTPTKMETTETIELNGTVTVKTTFARQ